MIQVLWPTLRYRKDNCLLKVVPLVKSNQQVLRGGQGLGFTFSTSPSLTPCPEKPLAPPRTHSPRPRERPAKGMVDRAEEGRAAK